MQQVGEERKRLRVSSIFLAAASPVFKTLFGPHFREGRQKRDAAHPVDIALPDDNSAVMTKICEALHFRWTALVLDLKAGVTHDSWILSFAIIVDKYALIETLRAHAGALIYYWLDSHKTCRNAVALGNIIAASWLLDHRRGFYLATEHLTRSTGLEGTLSLTGLYDQACLTVIPPIALGNT